MTADLYEAQRGGLSLGFAGDCLLTRRLSVHREARFLALRDVLRSCDAVFANLDTAVHRYHDGFHAQHTGGGGTYMTTEPELLEELKWLGVSLVSCGSSHADDYGFDGVMDTIRHLDDAGLVHAGSGRHLAEARAPAYLDTPRGRIGLVAATLHFNPAARAGEQRRDALGQPGVNAIRNRTEYLVPPDVLDDVRRIGSRIGLDAARARRRFQGEGAVAEADDTSDRYAFLGHTFRGQDGDAVEVRLVADERDVAETLRSVALARGMADVVICSIHCHDLGGPGLLTATRRTAIEDPSHASRELARRAIEAGADVVVGHGPQIPLGVEIHQGRPILHGMGTLIFEPETARVLPTEAYERFGLNGEATPLDFVTTRYAGDTRGHTADPQQWRQMVAVCDFDGSALSGIRLYPLDLGFRAPRPQRGRPIMAGEEIATEIIERVARISQRYGTTIENEGGIGLVTLA